MKLKTLRVMGVLVLIFCAFKLGELQGESNHLKRIVECVKVIDHVDLKTYYDHDIFIGSLFNHADGHNAAIYLKCIFKDMNRNE